jgi:hypothetical protein
MDECTDSPVLPVFPDWPSDDTQTLISQAAGPPDLWQVPLSFEWDQWAAYVEKFPGDLMAFNEDSFANRG